MYRRALGGARLTVPPECDPGHVYHLFPVRSAARDRLQAFLREQGIETLIHYPVPISRQPALRSEQPSPCPVADRVCAEILSLPMYPGMPETDVHEVAEAVRQFGA
jgi:dTDP-4-amino-4,6-dideoxygalactose transaminase